MFRCWLSTLLMLAALPAFAQEPKPPQLTPEEQSLADEATKLNREGEQLYQRGQPAAAVEKVRQALEIRKNLYPAAKYPDGHPQLATGLNNLGFVLQAMGQAEKASTFFQQSLDMNRTLFPASKYPDGHPELATGLNNLGTAFRAMGQAENASTFFQQSLDMKLKLYPAAKYPDGHPQLATGLNNLGTVLLAMGQAEKAATFYRQSLDMRRQLYPAAKYPEGHPQLADSLNNLGGVLQAMNQAEKAANFFQQSLDMRRQLYPAAKYPDGHPSLASSLYCLGGLLWAMDQAEKAATFLQQSLDMNRQLYPSTKSPDGHPHIATSLNNLGFVLQAMGQVEKAATFYQQSLDMKRKLYPAAKYPDGHPDLATSLNNLGGVLEAMGQAEKAAAFYKESQEMQQRYLRRELLTAPESAALDHVAAQPLTRDYYLNATRTLNVAAVDCYRLIAPSRSVVTRVLETRLATERVAGTAVADQIDELKANRRRTDQLLQDSRMNKDDRDKLLVKYADERDTLERALLAAMPLLNRGLKLDQHGATDLVDALPGDAVFVDLIRSTRFEFPDGKEKRTPSYVAFVLARTPVPDAPGSPTIVRIELGDANDINAAIQSWRSAIAARESSPEAERLSRLVWEPIAKHLPPGTKTLYLAPDGDLARLPWAALPIGKDRVLLEDYAIAQVPHGMFLLEQLKFGKKPEGANSLFTLGAVDYGPGIWPALPGTKLEVDAIAAIAPGERYAASGTAATAERLNELLPKSRYAHFATHGEFRADDFRAEKKRAEKAAESRSLGDDSRKIASKSPLGYVGIVLAGGKILSGLGIVDLPLQNTRLVTLSACETGLGDLTGGEGVQGLQRAFHLAGCPNVVASLWKVSDAATAALMAKFYHEMWVNKKEPIEALRTAQLTIYHHPELIPDLSGVRGAPKAKEALAVSPLAALQTPAKPRTARADTKLWAAFVLSGAGQ